MDPVLEMEGACIPWQNKYDIEPLLINTEYEYIQKDDVPGIRIHRITKEKNPLRYIFLQDKIQCVQDINGPG